MKVKVKRIDGGRAYLCASGEIDLYNVSDFKKELFKHTAGSYGEVIIDLSGVTYMDSSGIGALVAGHKKMKNISGKFYLLNIHEDVFNILKLATLDKFFNILEDEDDF
jgi:anti-sigma B factor antagonist